MKIKLKSAFFFVLILFSINLTAQQSSYRNTLISLCNTRLSTQINDPTDPNFGALVCLSSNPDNHPIHSRAAEAVYPFAIVWKLTGEVKYRDAAIKLGNWLIKIQETSGKKVGGWSEAWSDPEQKGWFGTTTDQLISLAGAFPVLQNYLSSSEISVCRGGSISNLWYEGFGENGYMQSSSSSSYKRIEPMHMP